MMRISIRLVGFGSSNFIQLFLLVSFTTFLENFLQPTFFGLCSLAYVLQPTFVGLGSLAYVLPHTFFGLRSWAYVPLA